MSTSNSLKASKCHVAQKEVEYLGHKITPSGVATESTKVEKMKEYTRPTNAKELHSFLGLIGYYRKFIINFAMLASHLTPLTSKKNAWKWEVEQETAFQKLKTAICTAPVLMQPNVKAAMSGSRPFFIYTDASKLGVGAVLAQENEEQEQHPIAFYSKALTPAETRYHVTDLEALAMIEALRRFKTIIYGTKVMVFTDHKPLMYILSGAPLADRLLRWSLELLEFDVKIVYIAGKANVVADALSRGGCAPIDFRDTETVEMTRIVGEIGEESQAAELLLDTKRWFQWLREEEGWKDVIEKLERGEKEGKVKVDGIKGDILLENYDLIGDSLRNTEVEECNRLVVPKVAVTKLISEAHEGKLAGHFGTEKIFRKLKKLFFWRKMRVDIENFVKGCAKCLCTNDRQKLVAPLTPYKTSAPLEIVACDLIDIGLSTRGNRYILTIIDLFTKYGVAVPIPDKKGETVVKAFIERWAIGEGRIPVCLLTDMGKEFVNQHFQQLTEMLKIEHITTKGYNSRANGAVERFNKTLVHTMKKSLTVPLEWDDQVPFAVYAYNAISHRTTGESPMFLFQGRDPRGPLEMKGEDAVGVNYANVDEYKYLMTEELLKAHKIAREHAEKEQDIYKLLFDEKHKTEMKKYPVPGSRVLVEVPAEKLGVRCPKLVNKWRGPYRVISCSGNSASLVPVMGKGKDVIVIPFDHLRVIPAQMGNEPILTTKNRASVKKRVEGDAACDEINEFQKHNDFLFSNRYVCRCPTPCKFMLVIKVEKMGRMSIVTTSMTQYSRMCYLTDKNPELLSLPDELQLLTVDVIPGMEIEPSKACWKGMSHCPTLKLWCAEIPGWNNSYLKYYQDLMKEFVKVPPPRPSELFVFSAACVKELPMDNAKSCKLQEDTREEMSQLLGSEKPRRVYLVIAFTIDEEYHDGLQNLVDSIPIEVEVTVIPAPGKVTNYSHIPMFAQLLKGLRRPHNGKMTIVSPEDMVTTMAHKQLAVVGDIHSSYSYWRAVKSILMEKKESVEGWNIMDTRKVEPPVKGSFPTPNGSGKLQVHHAVDQLEKPPQRVIMRKHGYGHNDYATPAKRHYNGV